MLALKVEQERQKLSNASKLEKLERAKKHVLPREVLYYFARAAIIQFHRLGGLNNRCLFARSLKAKVQDRS